MQVYVYIYYVYMPNTRLNVCLSYEIKIITYVDS
jgi:hypothetical protein